MIISLLILLAQPVAVAPTAAPAQMVDQERVAAARQLIGLLKLEDTYDRMFAQLTPIFGQAVIGILQADPATKAGYDLLINQGEGGQARLVAIIADEFMKSIRARYPQLKDRAAVEYAQAFTLAELRDMIAFYSSGTGAKALTIMPELQNRLTAAGREIGRAAGEEAGRRAFERAEKEMLPSRQPTKS
ncbi:hypothetical protein SCH01S_51_00210 [Sphingomonas changbaiensis NBRC 104936]|uniref:DUF2059 domain-containing protein n=1 Tax=Sphingomonas changbaiensis NBRC 104936 TaxID=1219043 RepID=A0A0E9MU72_9SPHN|nr:DUF2059 domain-containing protein [Sphingomonas changbaiensis]GAO40690.1 hypothetical protein SCH01S_51_00210 [Sphingomonas changbaiensis NBRC 104936]